MRCLPGWGGGVDMMYAWAPLCVAAADSCQPAQRQHLVAHEKMAAICGCNKLHRCRFVRFAAPRLH
jgi:hypothetical protein